MLFCFISKIALCGNLPSGVRITNVDSSSATIVFFTQSPCKGKIYYGLDSDNLGNQITEAQESLFHQVNLTGLETTQQYYFKIAKIISSTEQIIDCLHTFTTSTSVGVLSSATSNLTGRIIDKSGTAIENALVFAFVQGMSKVHGISTLSQIDGTYSIDLKKLRAHDLNQALNLSGTTIEILLYSFNGNMKSFDYAMNSSYTDLGIEVLDNTSFSGSLVLQKGFNLVGPELKPNPALKASELLFSNKEAIAVYEWDINQQSYIYVLKVNDTQLLTSDNIDDIELSPYKSYWIKCTGASEIKYTGIPVTCSDILSINKGFNFISIPGSYKGLQNETGFDLESFQKEISSIAVYSWDAVQGCYVSYIMIDQGLIGIGDSKYKIYGGSGIVVKNTETLQFNMPPLIPTIVSPVSGTKDVGLNVTLTGSIYSDVEGDTHIATAWEVLTQNTTGDYVPQWKSLVLNNQTTVTVDSTNGEFTNDLTGYTKLIEGSAYWVRAKYQDSKLQWSDWSKSIMFTTLDEPGGAISGIIKNSTGKAGVLKVILEKPGSTSETQIVADDGIFNFPAQASGVYSVHGFLDMDSNDSISLVDGVLESSTSLSINPLELENEDIDNLFLELGVIESKAGSFSSQSAASSELKPGDSLFLEVSNLEPSKVYSIDIKNPDGTSYFSSGNNLELSSDQTGKLNSSAMLYDLDLFEDEVTVQSLAQISQRVAAQGSHICYRPVDVAQLSVKAGNYNIDGLGGMVGLLSEKQNISYTIVIYEKDSIPRVIKKRVEVLVNTEKPFVYSCDNTGLANNGFIKSTQEGDASEIWVRAENLLPDSTVRVYICADQEDYSLGQELVDVSGEYEEIKVDMDGLVKVKAWNTISGGIGAYDVILDLADSEGKYGIYGEEDLLDGREVPGFIIRSSGSSEHIQIQLACDSKGEYRDQFFADIPVFIKAKPLVDINISGIHGWGKVYVQPHKAEWFTNDELQLSQEPTAGGVKRSHFLYGCHYLNSMLIWSRPDTINGSSWDMIVDVNENGVYDKGIDLLDNIDNQGNTTAGFITGSNGSAANMAPEFVTKPKLNAFENERYTYYSKAKDVNPFDIITYTLEKAPSGMSIYSTSGQINWTPTNTQTGTHQIKIKATDNSKSGVLSTEQTFTIIVKAHANLTNLATKQYNTALEYLKNKNITMAMLNLIKSLKNNPNDLRSRMMLVITRLAYIWQQPHEKINSVLNSLKVSPLPDLYRGYKVLLPKDSRGKVLIADSALDIDSIFMAINDSFLKQIEYAIVDLDIITKTSSFLMNLTPDMFGRTSGLDQELDIADVYFLKSSLLEIKSWFKWLLAHDMTIASSEVAAVAQEEKTMSDLLDENQSFFLLHSKRAVEYLQQARIDMEESILAFTKGLDNLDAETDDQTDDLISYGDAYDSTTQITQKAQQIRANLNDIKSLMQGVVSMDIQRSSGLDTITVDLTKLYDPQKAFNRNHLPDIKYSRLLQTNVITDLNSVDPTIGGLFPDMDNSNWKNEVESLLVKVPCFIENSIVIDGDSNDWDNIEWLIKGDGKVESWDNIPSGYEETIKKIKIVGLKVASDENMLYLYMELNGNIGETYTLPDGMIQKQFEFGIILNRPSVYKSYTFTNSGNGILTNNTGVQWKFNNSMIEIGISKAFLKGSQYKLSGFTRYGENNYYSYLYDLTNSKNISFGSNLTVLPAKPIVTIKDYKNGSGPGPLMESSVFKSTSSEDIHTSTSWEVYNSSYFDETSLVWSSKLDSKQLLKSVPLEFTGTFFGVLKEAKQLEKDVQYWVRIRHHGIETDSEWSDSVSFTLVDTIDIAAGTESIIGNMDFVYVPAGRATLGIDWQDIGILQDVNGSTPRFDAVISGFKIGKFEVSNEQFKLFVDANGYSNSDYWTVSGFKEITLLNKIVPYTWNNIDPYYSTEQAKYPVTGITFHEAQAFCKWADMSNTIPDCRLPFETEWEMAAHGAHGVGNTGSDDTLSQRLYSWGSVWDGNKVNSSENIGNDTFTGLCNVDEAIFAAGDSPYGCRHILGNASEYCYDLNYWKLSSGALNPNPEDSYGNIYTTRGGNYNRNRYSNHIYSNSNYYSSNECGFRVVIADNDSFSLDQVQPKITEAKYLETIFKGNIVFSTNIQGANQLEIKEYRLEIYDSTSISNSAIVWFNSDDYNSNYIEFNETSGTYTGSLSGETRLNRGTNYWVRVRVTDIMGNKSLWSDLKSIEKIDGYSPSQPKIIYPADISSEISLNTPIYASNFADRDLDDSQAYTDWEIHDSFYPDTTTVVWKSLGDTKNFTSIFVNSGDGTFVNALNNKTSLMTDTNYWVRCRYCDSLNKTSDWSEFIKFRTVVNFIPTVPSLITSGVTNILGITAQSGGNITSNGGATIEVSGVCWSTIENPTYENCLGKTTEGTGIGAFLSGLTGLTESVTYYVRAYATNSVGTAYGNQVSFKTLSSPVLMTTTATVITSSTVISGGTITSNGGAEVTERGVCWSIAENPTISDSKTNNGSGLGLYTSNITGLTAFTSYYLRAYATNGVGTAYGNQISFTTSATFPTLTTTAVTSITVYSAKSGGNISSNGGSAITEKGVCWSTLENPTTANSFTADGTGVGVYNSDITGLKAGTTYYVRSYAVNSVGKVYGEQVIFETAGPKISNVTIGNITDQQFTVLWRTDSETTTQNDKLYYTTDGTNPTSESTSVDDSSSLNKLHVVTVNLGTSSANTVVKFYVKSESTVLEGVKTVDNNSGNYYTIVMGKAYSGAPSAGSTLYIDLTNSTNNNVFVGKVKYERNFIGNIYTFKTYNFIGIVNYNMASLNDQNNRWETNAFDGTGATINGSSFSNMEVYDVIYHTDMSAYSIEGEYDITNEGVFDKATIDVYKNRGLKPSLDSAIGSLPFVVQATNGTTALSWNSAIYNNSSNDMTYVVEIGAAGVTDFTGPLKTYETSSLSVNVSDLEKETVFDWYNEWNWTSANPVLKTYYWRIRPIYKKGQADQVILRDSIPSNLRYDRSNELPAVPADLKVDGAVADANTIATPGVNLSWTASTDPEGLAVTYAVDLDTSVDFTAGSAQSFTAISTATFTPTAAQLTGFKDDTTYYWRIKAIDQRGAESAWSPVSQFYLNKINNVPVISNMAPTGGQGIPNSTTGKFTANVTNSDRDTYSYTVDIYSDIAGTVSVGTHTATALPIAMPDITWTTTPGEDFICYWKLTVTETTATLPPAGAAVVSALQTFVKSDGDSKPVVTLNAPTTAMADATNYQLGEDTAFTWTATDTDSNTAALTYDVAIFSADSDSSLLFDYTTGTDVKVSTVKTIKADHGLTKDSVVYYWGVRANDNAAFATDDSRTSAYGDWKRKPFYYKEGPTITNVTIGNITDQQFTVLWRTDSETTTQNDKLYYTIDGTNPTSESTSVDDSSSLNKLHVVTVNLGTSSANTVVKFYVESESTSLTGVKVADDNSGNYYTVTMGKAYSGAPSAGSTLLVNLTNSNDTNIFVCKLTQERSFIGQTFTFKTYNYISTGISNNKVAFYEKSNRWEVNEIEGKGSTITSDYTSMKVTDAVYHSDTEVKTITGEHTITDVGVAFPTATIDVQ